MTNTLEFSTNWNGKLHTTVFHTLRRSARYEVGDTVEVYLEKKLLGAAQCITKTRYTDITHVPEAVCFLDTGYGQAETENILARMYKEDPAGKPLYGYLFKWTATTAEKKALKQTVIHQTALAL